jgi:DNA sulfur modification protein DndB
MLTLPTSKINVTKLPTAIEAQTAATREAASTGANVLPAVMFKQGQRTMLSTAFPVPLVRNRLQVVAAQPRGSVEEVRSATNRPTMPDHVENVKNYIKENVGARYIIPPMTLNVRTPINIYMPDYPSTLTAVYMVMPASARLEITDGGHRKAGIDKASSELTDDQLADFDQDAVSVMITVEDDLVQIHQDFADCSKTKALPKSQLAAYDRRNPANGLVLDIIAQCPIFTGKIDSTSTTLSKNSTKLFLTNQVRQMVKELLVGQYAMADGAFEEKAKQLLVSSEDRHYVETRDKFVAFINHVTEALPVWKEISKLPEGLPRNKITDFRAAGWVCLLATGLVVIGRVGHELFKHNITGWEAYATRLGALDWQRSGRLWDGNVVQNGRVMTQQAPVRGAFNKVRDAIGLQQADLAA